MIEEKNKNQTVVFGGGCFWCTEAIFKSLKGVISVLPGYAGGTTDNPTYEDVCTGITGHAEVIKIEYNPETISFDDLLTVFFSTHDPTTPNRQGADVGTQYRSAIFYTTGEQKEESEKFIEKLNESGPKIVTEITKLDKFFEAEDYHKDYYSKNTSDSYCQVVINPKLEKLKKRFSELLK
ncbi:MAG: peptide-methionine (S)-S-oxide reductase [Candidatus Yanofskybacteria bacterium CG10_big_fil_rev_8_21_14_0_10_36_16]|uniref:Peptide methionine sulfoxide reductase MsrA n=1 Tax=Candidatus Yanofskybacteria bacterium CG10_big_fil_rev_8_21_14_0_10_36_16 TaxID=1975096 RepID=A0A2J0QBG9_9BACT|nr:MAG: peptide-methionine (S)-S-oxide reductase [Candidatus Yanofskybacteria bacterium CG10_big_fil_rev_8_21_14_0_10_36_16]